MFQRNKMTLVLVILLTFTLLLAACGGSNDSKNNNKGKDGDDEAPFKITFAFLASSNVDDHEAVSEEISKITEEKINATVELLPISPSAWSQQMNLMMTGEEKLDLVVTSSELGFDLQSTKGMLLPLNDLLDEHGASILEVVDEDVLEGTKVNDDIFAVPSVRDWARQYGFYMRKDLVEKYDFDLDSIERYEDLEPLFETIKENEEGMYPIANTNTPVAEIIIGDIFDSLGDSLGVVRMGDEDLEVTNMFEDPEYIEKIEMVRDWYEKGYIMKDASTVEDLPTQIIKSGKGFGAFSVLKPGFEIQESSLIEHEMVSVELSDVYQQTIRSWMVSIPRAAENPEKSMEFMDLLYSDEDIMNLIALGIEGEHYEINEEGFAQYPDGGSSSDYHQSQWQIGNNFLTHVWEGNDLDLWEKTEEFNNEATPSEALGFAFNPEEVTTELASINNVIEQYRQGLELGVLDPDKNIKEFNEKLKASGIEKVIEAKQKQMEEWKENQ